VIALFLEERVGRPALRRLARRSISVVAVQLFIVHL
jgi:hypothetical protein